MPILFPANNVRPSTRTTLAPSLPNQCQEVLFPFLLYFPLSFSSLTYSKFSSLSFDDATLRVLQSLLVSKDVKSLMQVRSSFTEYLRSQSLSVIRSIGSKTVQEKLLILDFFVRAFAVVGDVEVILSYVLLLSIIIEIWIILVSLFSSVDFYLVFFEIWSFLRLRIKKLKQVLLCYYM